MEKRVKPESASLPSRIKSMFSRGALVFGHALFIVVLFGGAGIWVEYAELVFADGQYWCQGSKCNGILSATYAFFVAIFGGALYQLIFVIINSYGRGAIPFSFFLYTAFIVVALGLAIMHYFKSYAPIWVYALLFGFAFLSWCCANWSNRILSDEEDDDKHDPRNTSGKRRVDKRLPGRKPAGMKV